MRENERRTGGPRSGGMMILLFPPGLMSLIPSSNPTSEKCIFLTSLYTHFLPFMALLGVREKQAKDECFLLYSLQGN